MAQWLKDLGICDYDFVGAYPYNQYKDNEAIADMYKQFNAYIGNGLQTFFNSYKENIRFSDNTSSGYSQFYLFYYYGMYNKGATLNVVANFYDSGFIRYESNDGNGNPYLYDDFTKPTGEFAFYTDQMTNKITAEMAAWSLDRRHQVFSIPVLYELFARIYNAYQPFALKPFDLNEIEIVDNGKTLDITLPNNDLWKFVQKVAMAGSNLILNIPYGNKINVYVKDAATNPNP